MRRIFLVAACVGAVFSGGCAVDRSGSGKATPESRDHPTPLLTVEGAWRIDRVVRRGDRVVVIGRAELVHLDADLRVVHRAPLGGPGGDGHMVMVDLDGDGLDELVRHSNGRRIGQGAVDAFTLDGELLWRTQDLVFPEQDRAAGFLLQVVPLQSEQGAVELAIVASHNTTAIRLNSEGQRAGELPWDRPNSSMSDLLQRRAGNEFEYLCGSDDSLTKRGPEGAVLWRVSFERPGLTGYISSLFALTPEKGVRRYLALVSYRASGRRESQYFVIRDDVDSPTVREAETASIIELGRGTVVQLAGQTLRCLARFEEDDLLHLCVWDATGARISHEALCGAGDHGIVQTPRADTILALEDSPQGAGLLVGAGEALWFIPAATVNPALAPAAKPRPSAPGLIGPE